VCVRTRPHLDGAPSLKRVRVRRAAGAVYTAIATLSTVALPLYVLAFAGPFPGDTVRVAFRLAIPLVHDQPPSPLIRVVRM